MIGPWSPTTVKSALFLKENILPIEESGQLKLIEEEGEFLPNITAKLYHGHTEGQLIPHINYHLKTDSFDGRLAAHQQPDEPIDVDLLLTALAP